MDSGDEAQGDSATIAIDGDTERERVEAALRESEARYHTLFDAIDEGFCVVEVLLNGGGRPADYRFLEINRAFAEETGLDGAEGKTALELVPDLEPWWIETYGAVALTGEPVRFENRAEAMQRTFEVYAFRLGAPDRRQVAIRFKNITERKRLEARARFQAALGDVLRQLTDPVAIQAAATRVLGEHLAASRVHYGEISDDGEHVIIERDYTDGVIPLAGRFRMDDFGPALVRALRAGHTLVVPDVTNSDHFSAAEQAAYVPVMVGALVGVPLIKDGRFAALLGVHQRTPRDWTAEDVALIEETAERTWAAVAQARAEAELEASRGLTRDVLDSMSAHIAVLDKAGTITFVNESWQRFALENGADVSLNGAGVGANYLDVCGGANGDDGENAAAIQHGLRAVLTGTTDTFSIEYPCHSPTTLRWFLMTASPLRHGGEGAVISHHDITARRLAEVERERLLASEQAARTEAEAANRAKDEFLSVLSHELRTPLTPIVGYVQLLRRGTSTPERLRLGLEMIERNARIEARIVEDLLDVSRILSGKLLVELAPLELPPIVRAAADAARPAAEAKGVALGEAIEDEDGWVIGDQVRLRQVVDNLLSNAIKFTPAGGRIDVSLGPRDGESRLTLTDTGMGIPPRSLSRVFDRFHQADSSSTRPQGGLGLGLAIVRHLVERHGGRVSAESAGAGLGSTFTVRLPLIPRPDDGQALDPAGEAVRGGGRLAGLRILVVDDDEDTRAFLRTLIADEGARVQTAASSEEAIAALGGARFDLLIADIGMPSEDGNAMIARLRARGAHEGGLTPAIALTAYASTDDRQRALAAGFQRHLAKPADLDVLVAEILATVGERSDA